jgi:hypothetical protein
MDKPKGKLRFYDNLAFMRYVAELPTMHRRIVSLPGQDTPIVIVREGDNPPEVAREARHAKEN